MTENKSPKKDKKRILIVLAVLAVVLLAGYVYKDKIFNAKEARSPQEENSQGAETGAFISNQTVIQGTGKVAPIAGVDIKTLKIVSLGEVTDVKEDGEFNTSLYKETVTPVTVMLPDKEFGLMGLSLPNGGAVTINIQTTAETLVFMSPYLLSVDPEVSNNIINIIKEDVKVKEFAAVIEKVLQRNVEPLDDPEYKQAFGQAIESVLTTLNK